MKEITIQNPTFDCLISFMIIPPLYFLPSYFYDRDSEGSGEGAGYGRAFLGLITLANGILILVIGILRWIIIFLKKEN